MAGKPGSRVLSGTTEVTTAQTPVQLTKARLESSCIGVWVGLDPNATGTVGAVGDKNVNAKATAGTFKGVFLKKEQAPVFIEIGDPTELWADVATSKDFVTWTAVLA